MKPKVVLPHSSRKTRSKQAKFWPHQKNLAQGRGKSVLHFVTSSRAVRGTLVSWRPDPLGAMYVFVRVWPTDADGKVIFDPARCIWKPCLLKLTGNGIKIMQPTNTTNRTHKRPHCKMHVQPKKQTEWNRRPRL